VAQKSSKRLQTLLRLAEMKEQAAVRQLAATIERLHNAEQQSQQLAEYEQDYRERYIGEARAQPVGRQFLMNFSGFFRQLENAQVQQGNMIVRREHEQENARRHWIELHAKRRLLANVRQRRLLSEMLVAEKKLQREIDDRAARKHFLERD
jgi:flagellar FliJ protein